MSKLKTQIEEIIKQLVVEIFELGAPAAEIDSKESLFGGDLAMDSFATLEIVTALEEEFGIAVEDDEITVELFDSIDSLSIYVTEKVVAGGLQNGLVNVDRG